MEISKTLYVKNRDEWRCWLEKNYSEEKEIWITFYKKHTGKPCVKYDDAVEEALCFGWIDSIVKRIDDEIYVQKFSVRKKNSKWSESNKIRIIKMVKEGKMTDMGYNTFMNVPEVASLLEKPNAIPARKIRKNDEIIIPMELQQALDLNKLSKENFEKLPPSHRREYIHWMFSAKRAETIQKRIAEAILMLANNQKVGMK